jgi:hypothetical protein
VVSSAFFLMAGATFFAIAATFTFPVAVATVWALPVAVRVAVAVLSFSPPTIPVPVPIPTITSFAVAMILAGGAMTFRVIVMAVRAVCKWERRREVSTVLESCLLVEGAPVDWQ